MPVKNFTIITIVCYKVYYRSISMLYYIDIIIFIVSLYVMVFSIRVYCIYFKTISIFLKNNVSKTLGGKSKLLRLSHICLYSLSCRLIQLTEKRQNNETVIIITFIVSLVHLFEFKFIPYATNVWQRSALIGSAVCYRFIHHLYP